MLKKSKSRGGTPTTNQTKVLPESILLHTHLKLICTRIWLKTTVKKPSFHSDQYPNTFLMCTPLTTIDNMKRYDWKLSCIVIITCIDLPYCNLSFQIEWILKVLICYTAVKFTALYIHCDGNKIVFLWNGRGIFFVFCSNLRL